MSTTPKEVAGSGPARFKTLRVLPFEGNAGAVMVQIANRGKDQAWICLDCHAVEELRDILLDVANSNEGRRE